MTKFDKTLELIKIVLDDSTTPRMVREKLTNMHAYIQNNEDDQRNISTALTEIEDMSSDVNIPPYVRTQLYGISSELEAIGN